MNTYDRNIAQEAIHTDTKSCGADLEEMTWEDIDLDSIPVLTKIVHTERTESQ